MDQQTQDVVRQIVREELAARAPSKKFRFSLMSETGLAQFQANLAALGVQRVFVNVPEREKAAR